MQMSTYRNALHVALEDLSHMCEGTVEHWQGVMSLLNIVVLFLKDGFLQGVS